MNFPLPYIPERPLKPRTHGLTMVMDKGLSTNEAENFVEASGEFTDFIKLGFGTSLLCKNLKKKLDIYKSGKIQPYFGGTLFEAFLIRGLLNDYIKFVEKHKVEVIEVSDGSMNLPHDKKCEIIHELSKKFRVISEVGSKDAGIIIAPAKWIKMMKNELDAGSFKVIAEARESGNVGIYRPTGGAHTLLINKITAKVKPEDIIWETPQKAQAVWFIKHFGANVNLGNIATGEVIPTETLRLGLRGDTFLDYLPENIKNK